MRLRLLALVLILLCAVPGWAQVPITLTFHTAQTANTSGGSAPVGNYDDATFVVTGTFAGQVNFQVVNSGGQVQALQCRQQGSGAFVTAGTVADTYECLLPSGAATIQSPTSNMTSGSVTVTCQLTFASRQRFGQLLLGTSVKPTLNQCLVGNGTTWNTAACNAGGGVTTTGSPANGNLTKFSGATTLTNADLAGDVTTAGTTTTTVGKVNGVTYPTGPAVNSAPIVTATNTATYVAAPVFNVLVYGAKCDGVTDDSTAIGSAITAASSACGVVQFPPGTCIMNSQITTPSCGFRITGAGAGKAGQGNPPTGGTILQMGFSGATAKIVATNSALFEIDHLTLQETSSSTTIPFISTTNTILYVHDLEIVGHSSKSGTGCNQDAIVFGNSPTFFAGYGTVVERVHFDRIRRAGYFQNAANNIVFRDNAIENNTGSNITTAITAATNANPAVLTVTAHGFVVGSSFSLTLAGFTGNWTPLNSTQTITVVDANTFSVPVNSTTFGALTGSPTYFSGAALEFVGATSRPAGNYISGNLFETIGYPYAVILGTNATENVFIGNGLFDPTTGTFIAGYRVNTDAQHNTIIGPGRRSGGVTTLVLEVNSPPITTIIDGSNSGSEQFVNPLTMIGALSLRDSSAAFNVTLAPTSSVALTANRTLTLDTGNVAHTLALGTTANTITFPNVASGTVAMLNAANIFTTTQVVNQNGGTPPAFTGLLDLVGANASTPLSQINGYGGAPTFLLERAQGTLGGETAVSTQSLGLLQWGGFDGTAYGVAGQISAAAVSTWTTGNHELNMRFLTVPNGSVTLAEAMRIQSSGGVSIGNTTDRGIGTLNLNIGEFLTEAAAPSGVAGSDVLWGDSTAHRLKMNNNNGGALVVAANPMTSAGDLIYGGASGVETRLATGTAKQVLIAGATPSYISFPDVQVFRAANCVNGTATSFWSQAATPTVVCRAGANNLLGVLGFADAAASQFEAELPLDWDTTQQPYVNLFFSTATNASGTIIFQVQTACSKADGSVTDDPAFTTAQVFSTVTSAAANRNWSVNLQFNAVTSGNNCIPGGTMLVKFTRNTDTAAAVVWVEKAALTIPRLLTVQAN